MAAWQIGSFIFDFFPPLMLGIAQWLVMRRYFQKSGWWIAATTLSLWIAMVLPSIVHPQPIFTQSGGAANYIFLALLRQFLEGLSYGVFTLIALGYFARNASPNGDQYTQAQPIT